MIDPARRTKLAVEDYRELHGLQYAPGAASSAPMPRLPGGTPASRRQTTGRRGESRKTPVLAEGGEEGSQGIDSPLQVPLGRTNFAATDETRNKHG
jgi:hypothetical protein